MHVSHVYAPGCAGVSAGVRTCAPIAFQSVTLSALTIGATERSTSESSTADVHAASFADRFSLFDIDMILLLFVKSGFRDRWPNLVVNCLRPSRT
jgi:hypothetical protein